MKMTILFTLILSTLALLGCAKGPGGNDQTVSASSPAQAEIRQVTVAQAKEAVSAEDVQFIDVRTDEEYASGHAVKTAHFPLDKLEADLGKLDKNKPVYVICQTGRRSQKGAEILRTAGFADIYNVQGGTSAWAQAGYPMEK